MPGNGDYIPVQTIKVDNKKLHGKYIAILTNAYHDLDVEKFVSQFGQRISEVNHLICTDDHVVIRYKGNGVQLYIQNKNDKIFNPAAIEDKVIVPEGIKVIGERAFITEYEVREIQLPASLEEIGDYAFFELNELKNLVIPKNVKKIGKKTIY